MPIYEYQCEACGHAFEKMMKVRADPPPCPECGADQVQKQVSAAGFILKGGGWYKDHYGLKSGGDSKKSDSSSSSSGDSAGAKAKAISKAASSSSSSDS